MIPVRTFRTNAGPQPARPGKQATTETVYSVLGDRADIQQSSGGLSARTVHDLLYDLAPTWDSNFPKILFKN